MELAEQNDNFFKLSDFVNAAPDATADGASALIGPEGGVVTVTDPASPIYGASLRIPAGALDMPVKVIIQEGEHACAFGLGPSLKLLPSGLHFKRAATLTVYLDEEKAEDNDLEENHPAFYHFDESNNTWTHSSATRLERLGDAVLCELHDL